MSEQPSEENYVAVGEALSTMQIRPLPTGWSPLEAFVLVKCIDESGRANWLFRTTSGINDEELLGSMVIQTELIKADILRSWESPEDDAD